MVNVILYGLIFGTLGSGLGGVIGTFLGGTSKKTMALLLNISGGIMISVVFFDLLPQSVNLGGMTVTLCGVLLGALAVLLINDLLDSKFPTINSNNALEKNTMLRAGFTIALAMAIHNFPEGLAIGSSEVVGRGLVLALLISLHDIPEGIIMAVPLRAGGIKHKNVILYSLLSGLPTTAGAVVGYLIGSISPYFIATSMAVAGGAMMYVTFGEVFNRSKAIYSGRIPVIATISGVLLGLIIIYVL